MDKLKTAALREQRYFRLALSNRPLVPALLFTEQPNITLPTAETVTFNEGSSLNISCTATGKPDPDVTWIHKGQVRSSGSKTAHLIFIAINKVDAGMYTCRANNSAGTTEIKLNVIINCE